MRRFTVAEVLTALFYLQGAIGILHGMWILVSAGTQP